MKIVIHQSICGEVSKAWGLIKTTFPDNNIAKNIAFRADLQDQTGGISWVPAIRGFCEGDYFLIMKTFEDLSSDVRRGRKFSHVLIMSQKDIVSIDDLEQIINLLPEKIEKDVILEPIQLEYKSKCEVNNIPPEIQGRFNKLINGFVNIKNYKNTLIWVGQENFSLVVVELWQRLNEQERQGFQFGISFNNDNKETEGISLINVPESVQSKFVKSDYFIVGKNDEYKPAELIEQLLIGDSSVKERLHNFEKAIDSKPLSKDDINFVAKGIDAFEQLEDLQDVKKLNTLAHIIAQYAPSEKQGTDYKQKLLNKIVQLINVSKFSDFVVLRNFKTDSYKNSNKLLSTALIKWLNNNIFFINNIHTDYKSFFEHLKTNNQNWWDKTIENELKTFLVTMNASKTSVVYAWLKDSPSILSKITPFINKSKDSEIYFVEKFPKNVPKVLIHELKIFSLASNWFKLYAQILNLQLKLEEALTELLKIDQDKEHFDAINIILKGKNQKAIVDYAAKVEDIRMSEIAGKICYLSPKNLNKIDVLNYNWQKIWLQAIIYGNQIDTGLKEPEREIHKLFDNVIAGNKVIEELIVKISESEYGNILSYSNRSKLWVNLPSIAKNNFLIKTSAAILKQLSENSTTELPNDEVLTNHIIERGISDFLYYNRNNIKSVIPIFDKFTRLHDNNLRDYLINYSGHINAVEATQLGKLISVRRFSNSAYIIYDKSSKDNNWKFALEGCYHLLDILTRGVLAISKTLSTAIKIPTDEWWQSAEDLIIELYPNATSMTTIWKKSGGKESQLLMNTSAADTWNNALFKLRKGHFNNITMNDLLKEIKKQYEGNPKFKIIYSLRKNYIET